MRRHMKTKHKQISITTAKVSESHGFLNKLPAYILIRNFL